MTTSVEGVASDLELLEDDPQLVRSNSSQGVCIWCGRVRVSGLEGIPGVCCINLLLLLPSLLGGLVPWARYFCVSPLPN